MCSWSCKHSSKKEQPATFTPFYSKLASQLGTLFQCRILTYWRMKL